MDVQRKNRKARDGEVDRVWLEYDDIVGAKSRPRHGRSYAPAIIRRRLLHLLPPAVLILLLTAFWLRTSQNTQALDAALEQASVSNARSESQIQAPLSLKDKVEKSIEEAKAQRETLEKSYDDETDGDSEGSTPQSIPERGNYRELFSLTTKSRMFYRVFFEGFGTYDASLIPDPLRYDIWIVVAHAGPDAKQPNSRLIVCGAGMLDEALLCADRPVAIPIGVSAPGNCGNDLAHFNADLGPRNGRISFGPSGPYILYNLQSATNCMGIWLQDARMLLDLFRIEQPLARNFTTAVELRRPVAPKRVEKNFFLFWDKDNMPYVHSNLWPRRSFARLDVDGTLGNDLAPEAARRDQVCMAKHMPYVVSRHETVRQASNALAITLCKRADATCRPTDGNTYNMHIFHHRLHYDGHPVYEPYVLLFQRTAPFAVHAISQRSFWVRGRAGLSAESGSRQYAGRAHEIPEGHTERLSIVSMSWKTHGQKYHGFFDDPLFVGFGVEDSRAGAIDFKAEDLLQDMAFC